MILFHPNGLTILRDNEGGCHVFDPKTTLLELSKHVWSNDKLAKYRVDERKIENKPQKLIFEDTVLYETHRLRNVSKLLDDKYYVDPCDS